MDTKSFRAPLRLRVEGVVVEIDTLQEAIRFLDDWPAARRGPVYTCAKKGCEAALAGAMKVDDARKALESFARLPASSRAGSSSPTRVPHRAHRSPRRCTADQTDAIGDMLAPHRFAEAGTTIRRDALRRPRDRAPHHKIDRPDLAARPVLQARDARRKALRDPRARGTDRGARGRQGHRKVLRPKPGENVVMGNQRHVSRNFQAKVAYGAYNAERHDQA